MTTDLSTTDTFDPRPLLLAATDPTAADLVALRDRLGATAGDLDLLDVAYRVVDSPVGPLLLAATDAGLVRVAFEVEDHDRVVDQLAATVGSRLLRTGARTDATARQLDEYFDGRRRRFDVGVDLRLVSGFRRAVIEHLPHIEFGSTETYADVARAAGSPAAVRAVGTACGHNPVPIVVPCHRVVRSDGSAGGYLGGPDAKRLLLGLEAAA